MNVIANPKDFLCNPKSKQRDIQQESGSFWKFPPGGMFLAMSTRREDNNASGRSLRLIFMSPHGILIAADFHDLFCEDSEGLLTGCVRSSLRQWGC